MQMTLPPKYSRSFGKSGAIVQRVSVLLGRMALPATCFTPSTGARCVTHSWIPRHDPVRPASDAVLLIETATEIRTALATLSELDRDLLLAVIWDGLPLGKRQLHWDYQLPLFGSVYTAQESGSPSRTAKSSGTRRSIFENSFRQE